MIEILESILENKTISGVYAETRKIIDEALLDETNSFSISIIQFLVDCLGRNYDVTEEESSDPNLQLANNVYNSDINTLLEKDDFYLIKNFLNCLFESVQTTTLIRASWYSNAMKFLTNIIDCDDIPEESEFKGTAAFLSSIFLIPLTKTYEFIHQNNRTKQRQPLLLRLSENINIAFQNIPAGLLYSPICVLVAEEFTEAMESYSKLFIHKRNYLELYQPLFDFNNPEIIKIGLKSLQNLILDDSNKDKLVEFFYSEESEIMDTFEELLENSKYQLDVISLFCSIKSLDSQREILDSGKRDLIFARIFSKNKKLVIKVQEFIEVCGLNFWQTAVETFKKFENNDSKLTTFVDIICDSNSDFGCQESLRLVFNNKNDPHLVCISMKICIRIVERSMLENSETHPEILEYLPDILSEISSADKAVGVLFKFLNSLDIELLKDYYSADNMRLNYLIPELIATYKSLEEYFPLCYVMQFLAELREHYQSIEEECVKPIFNQYYNEFVAFHEAYLAGNILSCEILFKKIIFILEQKCFCKIPSERQLDELNRITFSLYHEEKFAETSPDFACIIRLVANVFKVYWLKFTENDVANLNVQMAASTILQFINKLFNYAAEKDKMNLFLAAMVGTSFMELALYFQPNIIMLYKSKVFEFAHYKFKNDKIKKFVKFLDQYIFYATPRSSEEEAFQEMLFKEWVAFNRHYINLDSKTASQRLIRFYNERSPFKDLFDMLLTDLYTRDLDEFRQTVAFSILSFDELKDMDLFKRFCASLSKYLSQKETKPEMLNSFVVIAARVLGKLRLCFETETEQTDTNRFECLEYLTYFIRDFNAGRKRKLIQHVPQESELMNPQEKAALASFAADLQR